MKVGHFPDEAGTLTLTLRPMLEGQPILFVKHDEKGGWYFLDGRQLFSILELALVPLEQVLAVDPSLYELADLPAGWQAFRESREHPWAKESSRTLEKTRERTAKLFEEMSRQMFTPPPGTPTAAEMLREDRGEI